MKFSGQVWTIVYIIYTNNEVANIKGAPSVRLRNFVFQFPGAEGGVAKI